MEYYSTGLKSPNVFFKDALFSGLAPDGGLYMPTSIPQLSLDTLNSKISYPELAFKMIMPFIGNAISNEKLDEICNSAFNFSVPLVKLDDNFYILELFHGPTFAFKDFAARFMARMMEHFMNTETVKRTILVATSGDTGSAVANGFFKVDGINVVILYPSKRVSPLQEKQLTTLGENISALEVSGSFDDCQKLVKKAFLDKELNSEKKLGSANSINISRLLPQTVYYAWAWLKSGKKQNILISVPSGNFGNITGGLIAKKMGLPFLKFIASVNENKVFPKYLSSGKFYPVPSRQTLSNAMDVGNPSNISRINALYKDDINLMKRDISSYSFNDDITSKSILEIFKEFNYNVDPHTAVGISGLKRFLKDKNKQKITEIVLSTAHPAKFSDTIEPILRESIDLPDKLKLCMKKKKQSIKISNSYLEFKNYLMSNKN